MLSACVGYASKAQQVCGRYFRVYVLVWVQEEIVFIACPQLVGNSISRG